MSPPLKHHYIPQCYLRQWEGPDGKICEYSRPFDAIQTRRCHTAATGYEKSPYSINVSDPKIAHALESEFMARVDQDAATVLQAFNQGRMDLSPDQRTGWSRFLMSLFQRDPERVAQIGQKIALRYAERIDDFSDIYPTLKGPSDPETFDEYKERTNEETVERLRGRLVRDLSDSERIGTLIYKMEWSVLVVDDSWPLLTSDRPAFRTNGIIYPNSYIALPIGPDRVFLATNNADTTRMIHDEITGGRLSKSMNDRVVSQALKYVYGTNDRQLRFVEKRLRKAAR